MTHDELAAELAALEQHLTQRVDLVRVVVDENGRELKRIYRCSFSMPVDWRPSSPDVRRLYDGKD
jgi:hypothetical protein